MKLTSLLVAFLVGQAAARKTTTVTVTQPPKTVTKTIHNTKTVTAETTITHTRTTKVTATVTSTATASDTTTITDTATVTTTKGVTTTDTSSVTETDTETTTSTEIDTVTTTATDTTTDTTTATTTETDSTTTTATVTVTTTGTTSTGGGGNPTATPFIGKGNILVFPGGTRKGFLISGGTWYAGGGTAATYTGASVDSGAGTFNLTTSKGPCIIQNSDSSLNCTATNKQGTVFGSTSDGNLTYSGSDVFYAAATATGSTQQQVFATSAPVALNLAWSALSS